MARLIAALLASVSLCALAQPALSPKRSVIPEAEPLPARERSATPGPNLSYEAFSRSLTLRTHAKRLEQIRILKQLIRLEPGAPARSEATRWDL